MTPLPISHIGISEEEIKDDENPNRIFFIPSNFTIKLEYKMYKVLPNGKHKQIPKHTKKIDEDFGTLIVKKLINYFKYARKNDDLIPHVNYLYYSLTRTSYDVKILETGEKLKGSSVFKPKVNGIIGHFEISSSFSSRYIIKAGLKRLLGWLKTYYNEKYIKDVKMTLSMDVADID